MTTPRAVRSSCLAALLLAIVGLSPMAAGQEQAPRFGPELQLYPTGVVTGVRGLLGAGERGVFTFRAAYNSTDRDDAGEHDEEEGGGPGVSAGYRRLLGPEPQGWFVGGRLDLWWMEIDWRQNPGRANERVGTTDTLVVQPTAEAGYRFDVGRSRRWTIEPSVAFGFEINTDTDGEDVGEGPILLLGTTLSYRF